MKRIVTFFLIAILLAGGILAGEQLSFGFTLSAEGQSELRVSTGDILTVSLRLNRTDAQDDFVMYAMQNEICYDKTFFRLVENSDQLKAAVRSADLALRDHRRAHYLSYLSLSGGKSWEPDTLVGTFQLEVIGTTGISRIKSTNCQVSLSDGSGSYPVTTNELTVSISDQCAVRFDTGEGSAVPSQIVNLGDPVKKPEDPHCPDAVFVGWFLDVDYTIPWNFASDRVRENLHLYAKWDKVEGSGSFSDVHSTDWFYADVEYVNKHGLMGGVGNGRFAPYIDTTRAMIVTILWRMEGQPIVAGDCFFTDVAAGEWYADAIRWANANQIVKGYSAEVFAPTQPITREQMATILYRYAKYKGYDGSRQADLSGYNDRQAVSDWAGEGLSWANAAGLINGLPGNLLAPQNSAARCQTAAILHRYLEKASQEGFL